VNFFIEYFKLIDLLALAALAALACAALVRNGSAWLFLAGILVAIWGAMRVTGWPYIRSATAKTAMTSLRPLARAAGHAYACAANP
jgi:Ni/Fe-hydrogenase subunit HybB-like protein